MTRVDLGDITLNIREDGAPDGPPVVFAHALGTEMGVWDPVIARLPPSLRLIRWDMRGHGASDCPAPPYTMGALVRDAERVLDHLNVRDCVFVGLSVGGMIAQGLASKRLDLVRAMVLTSTAARIATREIWADRIALLEGGGKDAFIEASLDRWFARAYKRDADLAPWRAMTGRTPVEGLIGACHAIAGTDFYTTTAALTLPTLGIAGFEDDSTPPDLVRETVDLVKGSEFQLIRGAGHLPFVEKPDEYTALLTQFLTRIGHI